ncbi:20363_t:CDS:1, partial [Cetraspora pellucida]
KTSIHITIKCNAKIKIIHLKETEIIQFEYYKNILNYIYTIEDINKLKYPEIIRQIVTDKACKSYSPIAIVITVKEFAKKEDLISIAQYLYRKEVTNI